MLNKKREQKLKNQLYFAFRIRRIFLLIPLLLLCLSFVIPTQVHAQTDDSYFLNMWLNTKSLADLKNVYPGHTNIIVATISDPDLSKIPASKVSGQKLIPKKPGKATISAVINGKKQSIRITVKSPAPTYDQLKSKKAGLIYDRYSGKCYVKIKFTNKSQRTITKVQLKTTLFFDDAWDDMKPVKKKNVKVNIKPGKSQTVKIYFGKYPVLAPNRWKYEILQFWYR